MFVSFHFLRSFLIFSLFQFSAPLTNKFAESVTGDMWNDFDLTVNNFLNYNIVYCLSSNSTGIDIGLYCDSSISSGQGQSCYAFLFLISFVCNKCFLYIAADIKNVFFLSLCVVFE